MSSSVVSAAALSTMMVMTTTASAGNWCENPSISLDPPYVTTWGFDPNSHRALDDPKSTLNGSNVQSLKLAWAFGLAGTETARSQPVIAGDILFVASTSGTLFALDRTSGCIKWQYRSSAPLHTSLLLGTVAGKDALLVGDTSAHINAIDANEGVLLWRTDVALFEQTRLTGAVVQHESKLIVPISTAEVWMARNPQYECCKAHGGVRLLDADTGAILWTVHLTPDATPQGTTTSNVARWGPSGAPIWSTPTIDAERRLIYVGSGQNYSLPATDTSDSILALALETGEVVWKYQATEGDTWNSACGRRSGPNCPEERGGDFDFGAQVIIASTSSGEDILLAGQKSGEVHALDPDAGGALVWKQKVGQGSALGGIHWGLAVSEGKVFVPISDPPLPGQGFGPQPGLYALDIDTGEFAWSSPAPGPCPTANPRACWLYYRMSAAPTALPGVVFAPSLDGILRAFSTTDGRLLWQFDTNKAFATVNGVDARGGSMDSAGVIAAGNMIYVQSGYGSFGQLPGNVLLAFAIGD